MDKVRIVLSHPGHDVVVGFWVFWLRRVRGFDPTHHGMKCLVGDNDPRFTKSRTGQVRLGAYEVDLEGAEFGYLCGVSANWVYANNLHVPFLPLEGEDFEAVAYTGMKVQVSGALPLAIPELPRQWHGYGPAFTTCRNFRWAVEAFGLPADKQRVLFEE
jgi:hypothetical protein